MSFAWGAPLTLTFYSFLPIAAASRSMKIIGGLGVLVLLLFIIYLMLRSLGLDRNTPPSMVFRKLQIFIKSFYEPALLAKKLVQAQELHDQGKLAAASDMYLKLFYFDGLTSSRAQIAIHNETILEGIEEICEQTEYEFPSERINRFREDLYDYFLVKTKYLAPADYDGTPLHRPENEDRFKDKLNLSQERQLIEGFEHFLTTLVSKIEKHIKSGAPIHPRGTKTSKPKPAMSEAMEAPMAVSEAPAADPFGGASADPFGSQPAGGGEIADPFAGAPDPFGGASADPFGSQPSGGEIADPFAGAPDPFGGNSSNAPLPPPPDPFGGGATPAGGEISAPDDLFGGGAGGPIVDPFAGNAEIDGVGDSTAVSHIPSVPAPQPTGGFPGLGMPGGGAIPAPPAPLVGGAPSAPQPTGGFPGFGGANAGFPQPTGAFPGLQQPPPAMAPGGFPPPGTGAFPPAPQAPTQGGFPNLGTTPNPAVPQPTAGFPGLQQPAPMNAGMPQPTGGFPGFQQPVAPMNAGMPQPTGGFPGFQQPPGGLPPNPFGNSDEKK